MSIDEIVREAVETIAEIAIFSDVPVLDEDKGNVANKLEISIAQQKIAVVVGWNGFNPVASERAANGMTRGTASIIATVFEKPVENRASGSRPHLLEAAQEIARELDSAAAEGMEDALHLKRISPVADLGNGVISCDIEFSTVCAL